MARKAKKTAKKTAKKAAKPAGRPADLASRLIDAALALAAERGWRDVTLRDIAEAAGVGLAETHAVFPSRQAVLRGFARRIDAEVLASEEAGATEGGARDRLFDVLMRRFDALAPYKAGLANILADQLRDPLALGCGLCVLRRSMACMLEAADLSAAGLRGALRIKGLSAVYLAALRAWLRDDSEDHAKAMAALDRGLGRLDRAAAACSLVR